MIPWKIWFDLRVRFFICLSFMLLSILGLIMVFPMLGTLLSWLKPEIPAEAWNLLQQYASDYSLFVNHKWFQEEQFVAACAIVFTLGGVMSEQKSGTVFLTLSLPVERRRWILYQAAFALFLVLALCMIAAFFLILGGFVYGQPYPIAHAVVGTLLLALVTFPWVGATLALTAFTRDKLRAALLVFGLWFLVGLLEKIPPARIWLPQHLLDLLGSGSFAWQPFIAILAIGTGGLILAVAQFEQTDY